MPKVSRLAAHSSFHRDSSLYRDISGSIAKSRDNYVNGTATANFANDYRSRRNETACTRERQKGRGEGWRSASPPRVSRVLRVAEIIGEPARSQDESFDRARSIPITCPFAARLSSSIFPDTSFVFFIPHHLRASSRNWCVRLGKF